MKDIESLRVSELLSVDNDLIYHRKQIEVLQHYRELVVNAKTEDDIEASVAWFEANDTPVKE